MEYRLESWFEEVNVGFGMLVNGIVETIWYLEEKKSVLKLLRKVGMMASK